MPATICHTALLNSPAPPSPPQVFPGDLLPSTYPHPDNPERIIGRSEVERRSDYIQLLHGQLGEQHPLVQLVHQCIRNAPARRPSAEELLRQLEAVRAQIEGPYGSQLVKVDVVKVGMVKALKEKDKEIGLLQQQLQVRGILLQCSYSDLVNEMLIAYSNNTV